MARPVDLEEQIMQKLSILCAKRNLVLSVCKIVCIAVVLCFLLNPSGRAFCERDPWYQDMSFHWAGPYVYVLWQEMVCDGQIYYFTENPVAWYYPDSQCTRAQLVTLLCKTFALPSVSPSTPSYPDVPAWYSILPGKPGYPWIEGALSGGITFVPKGQSFLPDTPITREDAVELLIRALDLFELAQTMSEQEVSSLLQVFSDYRLVSPDRQRSMACAIRFGIIDGYSDWTLKPLNPMSRGEAATIVYRSCLIRVDSSLNTFSPDGDGIDDTVIFRLGYLRNRGIYKWQVIIRDRNDREVRKFNPHNVQGYPPIEITWDGKDDTGKTLPDGEYSYQAWVVDYNDTQFFSVKKPITIVKYSLTADLSPTLCRDGDILIINAYTSPGATTLTATFVNQDTMNLTPASSNTRWNTMVTVGPSLPQGSQEVIITATFQNVVRQKALSFTKIKDLWITPRLTPNPASAGVIVLLECDSSKNVDSVNVSIFGGDIMLTENGVDGQWVGQTLVPLDTDIRLYPAVFTAKSGDDFVTSTVFLEIEGSILHRLSYVLIR